jgi:N-glycosylase/DNA lyase
MTNPCEKTFAASNYDLAATLTSGQAFRWRSHGDAWVGIIGRRWVKLQASAPQIIAQIAEPVEDWKWLMHYLQVELDLSEVLASFPTDPAMRCAVDACAGLRLLRQDPWECLASFILSSTKQIVQIQQIISLLCERFGESLAVPEGFSTARSFPSPERLALASEAELRDCKMGFRAPYLLESARLIAEGGLDLQSLHSLAANEAREELLKLPGVGPKIADCVLLFAYGFQTAFPVDVWVMKALRQLYFPRRRPSRMRLHHFTQTYFGRNAGYAQQYLFHYMRTRRGNGTLKPE